MGGGEGEEERGGGILLLVHNSKNNTPKKQNDLLSFQLGLASFTPKRKVEKSNGRFFYFISLLPCPQFSAEVFFFSRYYQFVGELNAASTIYPVINPKSRKVLTWLNMASISLVFSS